MNGAYVSSFEYGSLAFFSKHLELFRVFIKLFLEQTELF